MVKIYDIYLLTFDSINQQKPVHLVSDSHHIVTTRSRRKHNYDEMRRVIHVISLAALFVCFCLSLQNERLQSIASCSPFYSYNEHSLSISIWTMNGSRLDSGSWFITHERLCIATERLYCRTIDCLATMIHWPITIIWSVTIRQ